MMRREPRAVIVWTVMWLVALSVTAIVAASGQKVVVAEHGAAPGLTAIIHRFGPFAAIFIALYLLVWATTTVAAFRAVLRPHEGRYFFLRLGPDELRLAIMSVTAVVLVLVFGGVPAFLLLALASPLMQVAPAFARDIATLGAIATVCLDIWVAVRLSLIAVETFAERRFHLTAYWPLTKGRFWYLFLCYLLCFVLLFGLVILFAGAGLVVELIVGAVGAPEGADLIRRTSLLGMAGVLAILTAGFFVVSSTLFCACQAHAFRAILSARVHRPRPARLATS